MSIRNLVPVVIILLFVSGSALAEETVTLTWKLAKGDEYELLKEQKTRSTTTSTNPLGPPQTQTENREEKVTARLEVLDVNEDGNTSVRLTYVAFWTKTVSQGNTFLMSGKIGADGKAEFDVQVDSVNPMLRTKDVKDFFRQMCENILKLAWTMEITPQGKVVKIDLEGDVFADLPTDSQVTEIAAYSARQMLSNDVLCAALADSTFLFLPEKPVKSGDTWPVEHEHRMMGLSLNGSGKSTLLSVAEQGDVQVANIREETTYEVNADAFGAQLGEMLKGTFSRMGMEIEVSGDFKGAGPVVGQSESKYSVRAGRLISTTWQKLEFSLTGTLTMEMPGQPTTVEMEVESEVTSKIVWKKKP